jgi:23S rRNA pseudouridine2605 synthase
MSRERTNKSSEAPRKKISRVGKENNRPLRSRTSEKKASGSSETPRNYKKRFETDDKRPARTSTSGKEHGSISEGPRNYKKRFETDEKRPVKSRTSAKNITGSPEGPRNYRKRVETDEKRPLRERTSERRTSGTSTAPRKYRKRIDADYKGPEKDKSTEPSGENTGDIRLNKYLATSGICSRREADKFIHAGLVTVNGEVVTELGTKVKKTDDVRYNGERLKSEKHVYILLNKPKDYITTLRDPHAKRTVMELVQKACKERVYPVGRLDRNTTGVLLLTNDGELAKQLTHPSNNKLKIYHVSVDKSLAKGDFQKILEGFNLEDGFIKADELSYIDANDKKEIGIEIHSGRNHIVRRIFEYLGYEVRKLDRVYFAGLTKKGLERGKYRFLTEKEVSILKMGSYQ